MKHLLWSLSLGLAACGPSPAVKVGAVEERGDLEHPDTVAGRDGGFTAFYEGFYLWVFSDTALAEAAQDGELRRDNSWAWTGDGDASDGLTGFFDEADPLDAPDELLPRTDEEDAWEEEHSGDGCTDLCGTRQMARPGGVIADEERLRALVPYTLVVGEPGGAVSRLGDGVAIWETHDLPAVRGVARPESLYPTLLFSATELSLTSGSVRSGEDLYFLSCIEDDGDWPCTLAMVPAAKVLDWQAWVVWNGEQWTGTLADGEVMFDGAETMSLFRSRKAGAWVALYMEPESNKVVLRTADDLTGPWSEPDKVFKAEEGVNDSLPRTALAHPEYDRGDGDAWTMLVSYYRPGGGGGGSTRLVDVELEAR